MGRKKRGNDAIPSWSGFNYQGKVLLLYILKKFNEIIPGSKVNEYSVEIERQEDFVIICKDHSESFHQVKATLSKSKWSEHSEALDKLIDHCNNSDNPAAKCIFMVAKDITDWDDKSNIYSKRVQLFKDSGNIVGICDVRQCILSEIQLLNRGSGHPAGHEEVIYGELCLFLDQKVAQMHMLGHQKRIYQINFSEFIDIIQRALAQQQARQEFYVKERVFDYVTQTLQTSLSNLCRNNCGKTLSDCEENCAAKKAYYNIIRLPDLLKYCRIINPDQINGWENEMQYVALMSGSKFENAIYPIFYESKTPEKVDENGEAVLLYTLHCKAENQYIIPTLLDLSSCCRYGTDSLQNIFQNIKNNTEIVDALEGSGITVIPGNWEGKLPQADITSYWTKFAEGELDNINSYYKGIEIISLADILEVLRYEGNEDR